MRALSIAICLSATPLMAQSPCTDDAMIVFDGSGSMAEMGFNNIPEPRIFAARRAIAKSVPEIAKARRLGLVVYGPGGADGCSGLDLRFGPMADAGPRIVGEISVLEPAGETAIAGAVALAAEALDPNRPGTVVLVTDGKETCGGVPCQLAAELAAEGPGLTIHVIGFKVRGDRFSWDTSSDYENGEMVAECLADRTGGIAISTETVDELIEALRKTLGCNYLF